VLVVRVVLAMMAWRVALPQHLTVAEAVFRLREVWVAPLVYLPMLLQPVQLTEAMAAPAAMAQQEEQVATTNGLLTAEPVVVVEVMAE
jgi:hypothetical protein